MILGANGKIARLVETQLLNDKAFSDVKLTMLLREKGRADDLLTNQSIAIEGDVKDDSAVEAAVEDQDIVFDLTGATKSIVPTQNIIKAMQANGVIRVISICDLGTHSKTANQIETKIAQLYEQSGLDYTVLRLAWLNNLDEVRYQVTQPNKPVQGNSISRKSVAELILKIIDDPAYLSKQNVGVSDGIKRDAPIV